MPYRNLNIITFTLALAIACYLKGERNRFAGAVADAMHKVRTYYVEEVDSRQLFENAMNGMVTGLDQYSAFIGPDSYRQMEEELDQEFGGVGIEIDKPQDSPLMVLSPLFGTPAFRAGLQAGDIILKIEGQDTAPMTNRDAVTLMRGKPGSPVELFVQRPGVEEPFIVSIKREVIMIQSVLGDVRGPDGSWDYHLAENPRIAYLRLTTFGKHTVSELSKILNGSEGTQFEALLIDLRGNAGGLLDSAVDTCNLFVDRGRIVSTRGRDGQVRHSYEATKDLVTPKSVPIAVLTNHFSASASEIVAACLQDHERAVVVGERTWGKGTVQNILRLEGGRSALKLTTATYWRPSGQNIHRGKDVGEEEPWGVRPTSGFELKLTDEQARQVARERRRRDVEHGLKHRQPDDETAAAEDTENGEGEPVEDLQLRRAVDYLEERLRDKDAEARTVSLSRLRRRGA